MSEPFTTDPDDRDDDDGSPRAPAPEARPGGAFAAAVVLDRIRIPESELRAYLATGGAWGSAAAIVALSRRPCPYSSSYALEELDISLADGTRCDVIVK